jgi:hypothetical protein
MEELEETICPSKRSIKAAIDTSNPSKKLRKPVHMRSGPLLLASLEVVVSIF